MQLLVIEDSELDHEVLVATLAMQGWPAHARRVETAGGLRRALAEQAWDLVISDHCLPGFSSSQAFGIVRELAEPPPFIIVSGMLGEEAAVAAMQAGVDDYLVKGRLARLGAAVRNALAAAAARREKDRALARLHESRAQLRALSARLQSRVDEERTAVAREIHDDVGGTLAAVRFDLEAALREPAPQAQARIRRALDELTQAQQAAQRILQGLRPPILDAGLIPALQWLARQFGDRHGLAVRFTSNVAAVELPSALAMMVYRACQEGLTNVAKHAGADEVRVDLHCGAEELSLEIEDNGRGLDGEARSKPGSFGLRGLAERAHALGGQLEVSSTPGHTALLLWVPHAGAASAPADTAHEEDDAW